VTAAIASACAAGCAADARAPRVAQEPVREEAARIVVTRVNPYLVDRRADDLRRLGITGTTAIGKGAVDCDTGQIVVWSMGMPAGHGHERFEVRPPPRTPSRAIVACARRS
jgi:hypothetical protein